MQSSHDVAPRHDPLASGQCPSCSRHMARFSLPGMTCPAQVRSVSADQTNMGT